MAKKRNPGGCLCCSTPCPHDSDTFDRADSTTIGTSLNGGTWTESVGNWTIASNKLQITTTNARIRCGYKPTGYDNPSWSFHCTMGSTASGDLLRAILDNGSSSEAEAYVELKVGTGATLQYKRGATDVTCDVTAGTSTQHTIAIYQCLGTGQQIRVYLNDELIIYIDAAAGARLSASSITGTGFPGFGTGGTVTGTCTFNDYALFLYGTHNEVQTITRTGAWSGGTFKITFDGQQTGALAFNASAATVKAALEALPNIGAGNVDVTGTWVIEFKGALASTDVAQVTCDISLITGFIVGVTIVTTYRGFNCPTCAKLTCGWRHADRTWGTASQMKVTINGWADGNSWTGCTDLDGTWFLDPTSCPTATDDVDCGTGAVAASPCQCWSLSGLSIVLSYGGFTPETVTIETIRAFYGLISGGYLGIFVDFIDDTGKVAISYHADVTILDQCTGDSSNDLIWFCSQKAGTDAICDHSSITASIEDA